MSSEKSKLKKDLFSVLPSCSKLIQLWEEKSSNPKVKSTIEHELRLEHQKIRVVLQHILLHRKPPTYIKKAYVRRLAKITKLLDGACGPTCCPKKDLDVKTCDVTAETAVTYVIDGPDAFRKTLKTAKAKLRRDRRTCRHRMKGDGEVNWKNLTVAKDALARWATAECLKIQAEDLKVQEKVVGKV